MARPRKINPKGRTRKLSVLVAEPVARDLEREATREGKSLGEIMRRRLERGAA
jgi:hypothetical protein